MFMQLISVTVKERGIPVWVDGPVITLMYSVNTGFSLI